MRASPIRTSSARKIASDTSWSAVVFAAAEKNSDNSRMGTTSASAAAVMTSWPNSVVASPASFSIGSSSPADVDIRMIASKNGWSAGTASQKKTAQSTPSAAETPNASPASRDSGLAQPVDVDLQPGEEQQHAEAKLGQDLHRSVDARPAKDRRADDDAGDDHEHRARHRQPGQQAEHDRDEDRDRGDDQDAIERQASMRFPPNT